MLQKIVIIEDDAPIAAMYKFKLEQSGYTVKCAYNGQEGLQLLESFLPDLALVDLRMPIMSGDKMLEQLRTKDWGSTIRIVVLTNISKDEAPMNLRFLNIERYIVKAHHTPQQVLQVIQDILS